MGKLFWSFFLFLGPIAFVQANTQVSTELELNGEKVQAYFNDGDTFKINSGSLKGKRSRLEGFNALESFGPVHRWGSFTGSELEDVASGATALARTGGWHCRSDRSTDTYGRLLSVCSDLGAALVSKGLAHVMSVDKTPGDAELLRLQHEAMASGVGMWAKGVPAYIVTSLHSADENGKMRNTYDRLVSTEDGHSEMVAHRNLYKDCQLVCYSPDLAQENAFQEGESCMIYVAFNHRYGAAMASCLK